MRIEIFNNKLYEKSFENILQYLYNISLYSRGADVNAKDYKGSTPLRLARR